MQRRKWHDYIKLDKKIKKAFMVLQVETKNAPFGSIIDERIKQHHFPVSKYSSLKVVFEPFLVLDILKILIYPLKYLS